jgi:hypothetical protein
MSDCAMSGLATSGLAHETGLWKYIGRHSVALEQLQILLAGLRIVPVGMLKV